jgi:hypothetical protein
LIFLSEVNRIDSLSMSLNSSPSSSPGYQHVKSVFVGLKVVSTNIVMNLEEMKREICFFL